MLIDILSEYIFWRSASDVLTMACVIFGNTTVANEKEKIEIGKENIIKA
jgi:hypothetical protein